MAAGVSACAYNARRYMRHECLKDCTKVLAIKYLL